MANVGQWEFRIVHILITIGNYDYNHGLCLCGQNDGFHLFHSHVVVNQTYNSICNHFLNHGSHIST
jgi:hypothetical protein